jgi:hypothetical protein
MPLENRESMISSRMNCVSTRDPEQLNAKGVSFSTQSNTSNKL